jgi:hypothetical protein
VENGRIIALSSSVLAFDAIYRLVASGSSSLRQRHRYLSSRSWEWVFDRPKIAMDDSFAYGRTDISSMVLQRWSVKGQTSLRTVLEEMVRDARKQGAQT